MVKRRKPPKLPVQQLVILSICRFAEPVALTSVFPYLPEMIESFNVPKNRVAYWAGVTSAVFSLSQCLTGIIWGRASDKFGRKPVILAGMVCTMTTSVLFGFSTSLPWAIVARALAGLGNGTVGIIRTTVAEMVPQKELQPRAFSVMPLIWTIGSIFGPAFGGALANPAERHPELFGNNVFFTKYPFALPNMVACVFFLIGLTTGILFLKETLEIRKHRRDYGRVLGEVLTSLCKKRKKQHRWNDDEQASSLLKRSRRYSTSSIHEEDSGTHDGIYKTNIIPQAPPGYKEVFSRQSNINLLVYSLLALHSVAFDQLLPIFLHHPPQKRDNNAEVKLPFKFAGGFGIDSERIGLLFTLYGISGMLIQFLIFPPFARRFGILNCLKACTLCFPLVYLLTPFTALLPTPLSQQTAMFAIMLLKCCGVIFAFPCSTILLTNSAISLRVLGTLNGVATSVSALGRAAGPAIGGSTFSLGVDCGYVVLPWWTLAGLAAIGAVPVWWLVEMEGFGGDDDGQSEEGSDTEVETDDDHNDDTCAIPNTDDETDTRTGVSPHHHHKIREEEEDDAFAIEHPLPASSSSSSRKLTSSHNLATPSSVQRRMSSPLGMREGVGPGGGRRLSNNLGQTRSGWGTGGTSYH
ncbi:MAG: hypothetical protein M1830_003795 [Pleopsidium flavum]|nr:MAG: hypothetical protein M1830_003795 [Pleopsidium flavum]